VLALLHRSAATPEGRAALIEQVKQLDGDFRFETYFSLSCQNCPDVVQALNLMSVLNPRIRHVAIDGALFKRKWQRAQVMAVPMVYLNGEVLPPGA
jgi:alkyl hydroperoxide reductase subunit F